VRLSWGIISGMGKVAGIDSSSAGTTVVVCDTDTGEVLRQGSAPHPVGEGEKPTEIDPQAWLLSLGEAAKGGLLEGVQAIGIKSRGIGIAIRIADGNARALHAATVALLEQLDLLPNVQQTPLARFARPAVRNLAGVEVGRVEPIFSVKG